MTLDEVNDVVVAAVRDSEVLEMKSERHGNYLDISIVLAATGSLADTRGRRALLSTNGVEAFFLSLSNGFEHREFEHESEGQVSVLRLLVSLSEAYLFDKFDIVEEVRPFRRRRQSLRITLDQELYVFSAG